MKIAIDNVIFQLQKERPRGISRVWSNILPQMKSLLDKKHEVILLSRVGSAEENFGLKTYKIPQYRSKFLGTDDAMLTSICEKLNVDLFLSTYYTRAFGVKNLVVVHDLIPEIRPGLPVPSKVRSYLNADAFICVSENTKKDLYDWYDIGDRKVSIVYNGVSGEFYPRSSEEIIQVKEKYGLKSNYLILDGDITKEMSSVFCRAFSGLKSNLTIFSYGGIIQDFTTKDCRNYDIPLREVSWLEDGDIPAILSGSEGLVFLSKYEGFGLPILEAMACRTPILCSNVASLPEVGETAVMYFANYDLESVKDKLVSFFYDVDRDRLAEKGFIRSKLFTWEKAAKGIIEAIRDLDRS